MKKVFKKYLLVLVLSMLVLVLTGCGQSPVISDGKTGMLKVNIPIPSSLQPESVTTRSIIDEISLSTLRVTITGPDGREISKETAIDGASVTVSFEELITGEWSVEVQAIDDEGSIAYTGTGIAIITYDTVTEVTIDLSLTLADLEIVVYFPESVGVTSGTVTLINPIGTNQTQDLQIIGSQGNASFSDIQAKTWPIEVELRDSANNVVLDGQDQVNVLPGKTTTAEVNFNQGSLVISTNWELPPVEPTGLNLSIQDGSLILTWNANPEPDIAGYMVYRGRYEVGEKKLITSSLVSGHSYTDSDVVVGETYWYWVQAYNSNGVSSDLSDPISATFKYEGSPYFVSTVGWGIKYHVTDSYDGTDTSYWAVSQSVGIGNSFNTDLDYGYMIIDLNDPRERSFLGGTLGLKYEDYIRFFSGAPSRNLGNFYMNMAIPRYFTSGDQWSFLGRDYEVTYVGAQTINNFTFNDCIRVDIDATLDELSYKRGAGYIVLAKNIGIVELVFDRVDGSVVVYQYEEEQQFDSHVVSGSVTESGVPVEGIRVQLSTVDNMSSQSITDASGNFSIQVYGPVTLLSIGYDSDQDGVLDNDNLITYPVENITTDITDLNIGATGLLL